MAQFDELISRKNTRSVKWGFMEQVYNIEDASDILPMWVADMDFKAPQIALNAMQDCIAHGVFGYTYVCEGCKKAIVRWFEKMHDWTIDPETLLFHQGVIPAIATIIETFTKAGDKIAICSPVYPPFFTIPQSQSREIVYALLDEKDGNYTINFESLEQTFKDGAKLFILCNPHNPAGIVWSKEDLTRIIELAIQYDVFILSDEIHADLVFDGAKHTPILAVEQASGAKIATTIAPTKTFNLAGIQAAMIVAPNKEIFEALEKNANEHGHTSLNVFATAAIQAVYNEGEEWLQELKQYLMRNMLYVQEQLNAIKGIHVRIPQGTYLMWIDYRETGITEEEIMHRLLHKGKLALEPGTKYGEAGRGFLRINIACPFELVKDGVERFKSVFK